MPTLRVLPMECETGETRERIMKDTCWYAWNASAVNATRPSTNSGVTPAALNAAGVSCTPAARLAWSRFMHRMGAAAATAAKRVTPSATEKHASKLQSSEAGKH